jgi:hypothetical protein
MRGVALKITFFIFILVFASVLLMIARGRVLEFLEFKTALSLPSSPMPDGL